MHVFTLLAIAKLYPVTCPAMVLEGYFTSSPKKCCHLSTRRREAMGQRGLAYIFLSHLSALLHSLSRGFSLLQHVAHLAPTASSPH